MIEYRLIRSDRRTLSISIDREGALVVRAPKRLGVEHIEDFIRQKQRWIEQKQEQARQNAAMCQPLLPGAVLPYWGGYLRIEFGGAKKAVLRDGILWLPETGEAAQHVQKWRLQQARQLIVPRVECWAEKTGLQPSGVSFGSAKTRWGSMNHRTRSLRLNAALIHCPQDLVDYVIVHELVHILHPDHSPAFHAAVRRILPDADHRRKALKQYSCMIQLGE